MIGMDVAITVAIINTQTVLTARLATFPAFAKNFYVFDLMPFLKQANLPNTAKALSLPQPKLTNDCCQYTTLSRTQ